MLRNPQIIASAILSIAILISSLMISRSIDTLDNTIYSKQMSSSPEIKSGDRLTLEPGNSPIKILSDYPGISVVIRNDTNSPLYVKEVK